VKLKILKNNSKTDCKKSYFRVILSGFMTYRVFEFANLYVF